MARAHADHTDARAGDVPHAIIEAAAEDITRIVRGNEYREEILGTHLDALCTIIATVRGVAHAARSENPQAAYGAFRTFGDAIGGVVRDLESDFADRAGGLLAAESHAETLRARIAELERTAEDLRNAAAREQQRTADAADEIRGQLRDAGALAAAASDQIIPRLAAFVQPIPGRIDAVVREVSEHAEQLERLLTSDVEHIAALEEIDVRGPSRTERRLLKDEIRALIGDVAPFRGRRPYDLHEADRAVVASIAARSDAVQRQYRALTDLLGALERELASIRDALDACGRTWMAMDRDLRSALHVFPIVFDHDPFALAGATQDAIERKRTTYSAIRQQCSERITDIQRRLHAYRQRYDAIRESLDPVREETDRLRAFNDIPWYDALPPDEQTRIRAVVLAFGMDDRRVSRRVLHGTLVAAGVLPREAGEHELDPILDTRFFSPVGPPKMSTFRLTELAEYWREVWDGADPACAPRLAEARAQWMAEETQRAQTERTTRATERSARAQRAAETRMVRARAQAERAAEAERAHAMREHPANMLARLEDTDRQLLTALTFLDAGDDACPDRTKLVAAAVAVGIVAARDAKRIAASLRRLWRFDPPLLIGSDTHTEFRERFQVSDVAHRVAALLPTVADPERMHRELLDLLRTKARYWSVGDRQRYHRIRQELGLPAPPSQ